MRRRLRACGALLISLFVASLSVPTATARQAAPPQDAEAAARAALARPIDAGNLPFLIPHARYSNVAARLAGALHDKRADVRTVAARSIFVLAGKYYSDAVTAALRDERDPAAGAEMVRALMAIQGAAADAAAIAAARRLGPLAMDAVIVTLAHARPLDVLPHLAAFDASTTPLTDALLRAVGTDAGRVARALDDLPADPALAAPARMVTRAAELGIRLPIAIVEAGVRRDETRGAALVYLLDRPEEAHGDVQFLATLASRASSGWEQVMLELVLRGDPSSERRDLRPVLAALRGTPAPAGFWRSSGLSRLSPDERTELRVLAGPEPVLPAAGAAPRSRDSRWSDTGAWRSLDPLPGLTTAVAAATGCRQEDYAPIVLRIAYGNRGQVRSLEFASNTGSIACREAAQMLAVLEVAPIAAAAPSERSDYIVTVFRQHVLECDGRSAPAAKTLPVGDSGIVAPKKLRDVRPVFPNDLIVARIQGRVVVEATVERSGCVTRLSVVEPAHPALNISALAAVAQWLYEPTRLNGEPVAVIMTTTANFTLK